MDNGLPPDGTVDSFVCIPWLVVSLLFFVPRTKIVEKAEYNCRKGDLSPGSHRTVRRLRTPFL